MSHQITIFYFDHLYFLSYLLYQFYFLLLFQLYFDFPFLLYNQWFLLILLFNRLLDITVINSGLLNNKRLLPITIDSLYDFINPIFNILQYSDLLNHPDQYLIPSLHNTCQILFHFLLDGYLFSFHLHIHAFIHQPIMIKTTHHIQIHQILPVLLFLFILLSCPDHLHTVRNTIHLVYLLNPFL